MATTLTTIQAEVGGFIGDLSSGTATRLTRYANYIGRQFWHRQPWHERKTRGVVATVAPYATGTAAVAAATGVVTGTGTTFTSAMVGRKFARSLNAPPYVIGTFGGVTSITLSRASYLESTTADAAYTIYGDVLTLASDCDVVLGDRLQLLCEGAERRVVRITPGDAAMDGAWPKSQGFPSMFWDIENSAAGLRQIQVWPVPDGTYGIEYPYLTKYTDLVNGSDNWVVPDRHASLCIDGMNRHALRLHDDWEKAIAEDERFWRAVDRAWLSDRRTMPRGGRMRGFDDPRSTPRRFGTFNYTG